jgi:hypothetical protein
VLDARLREYERRYEMPSSELRQALKRRVLRDTADVSEWLSWWTSGASLPGKHGPNRLGNYLQVSQSCIADSLAEGFVAC